MRYRVKDYTVTISNGNVNLYFTAPDGVTLTNDPDNEVEPYITEAIRLVIDESKKIVLCSSMQKRTVERAKANLTTRQIWIAIEIPDGQTLFTNDEFTIEMDWGESVGDIAHRSDVKDGNDTAIGMLKDNTNGLAAIKGALPTGYALQGSGSNTLTDLYTLIGYTISEIDNA